MVAFKHEIMEWIISLAVLAVICFVIYLLAIAWGYLPNPNEKDYVTQSTVITPSPSKKESNPSSDDWEKCFKQITDEEMSQQNASQNASQNKSANTDLTHTHHELYKTFPFLDPSSREADINAILAVSDRKTDLEVNGIPAPEALSRALREVGAKHTNKTSQAPIIKRW